MGDDHGHQAILNNCLHLLLIACCYVGQEPDSLLKEKIWKSSQFEGWAAIYLVDFLLAVVQKAREMLQCTLSFQLSVISDYHCIMIWFLSLLSTASSPRSISDKGTAILKSEAFETNLVKDGLRLVISTSNNISHSSQSRGLDFHLHNVGKSWTREGDIFLEISRKAQSGASNASGCARIV